MSSLALSSDGRNDVSPSLCGLSRVGRIHWVTVGCTCRMGRRKGRALGRECTPLPQDCRQRVAVRCLSLLFSPEVPVRMGQTRSPSLTGHWVWRSSLHLGQIRTLEQSLVTYPRSVLAEPGVESVLPVLSSSPLVLSGWSEAAAGVGWGRGVGGMLGLPRQ